MTIYEFAEALIASFPSTFSEKSEFTYDPDECELKSLGNCGPDVSIMFCEIGGKDDVIVGMEFIDSEDCMNWLDQQGSKEFKRLKEFALKTIIAHQELLDEKGTTFSIGSDYIRKYVNYDDECSVEEDEDGNLNFCIYGVDFKMIKVEAGTFMMGAADNQVDEAYKDRDLPAHQVTISNDFYIAEVPVTWELWGEVMQEMSIGLGDEHDPVFTLDWYDTYKFINRLNEITGKQFRLPTEAEWEYAARGGNKSKGYKYSGSDNVDEVAWYDGNSHDNRYPNPEANTHPVKWKKPNELGLYDMSGNRWEQCHDGYAEYSEEAQTDPIGDPDSELKVLRGGCHATSAESCRTSHRFFIEAEADEDNRDIYDNTTYRLVLSPFMPLDIPTDFDEDEEEEDCEEKETISTREDMVGMPVDVIDEYNYFMDITDEESQKLKDGDSVKIYVGGPYFGSKKAFVEGEAVLGNNALLLNSKLYQLQSALRDKWEKNDYDHNFEDFVIEVFDMKITKGNVTIHIELGS